MKSVRFETIESLPCDVVEYLFTEWLVRRRVYSKYVSNLRVDPSNDDAVREAIRSIIKRHLGPNGLGVPELIADSFIFARTPEGLSFWTRKSIEWALFVAFFVKSF